jgi:membrane fusion protein, heavy metal efflux system
MNRIIYIIATLIFITACNHKSEKTEEKVESPTDIVQMNDAQQKMAGIATGHTEIKTVSGGLKVTGRIDVPPQNMVSISFPLGGYLKSTQMLPGMHVAKGEVIAVMEDPQYIQLQQDYLTTKEKLAVAVKEYNRQKELNISKASSDKVFEQSEAEYRTLEITLRSLAEKLSLIGVDAASLNAAAISKAVLLRSPINGFVSKVNVNIGKYVNPTDVLFEIVDPRDIHLALTIFEKDIAGLSIGQRVMASTNNGSKQYLCKIILIGQDVSPDRSIEVHCHFEQYDKALIPGMFMNAEIENNNRQAWALPEEAVVRYGNKEYVFIRQSANSFFMQPVTTGDRENGFIEIKDSLQGKDVVVKGAYAILMKAKNTEEEE